MRLVVQWPRLGPYHLARLRHAHGALAAHGVEVVALETAALDGTYDWDVETGATPYRRVQVFPGEDFQAIRPSRLERGVSRALDALAPDAVAMHSYSFPDARATLRWCRRHRRVAVMMNDSKEDDGPRVRWREVTKRVIVTQYDAALVAGTSTRAYFGRLGLPADAVFDGYDVVDNAYFARGAADARAHPERTAHLPGLDDPAPFFLVSSRFIERKNLARLLRAYAAYRRQSDAPWRLVLIGDGPLRGEIEAFLRDHHVGGVTLAGWHQLDVLPAYYGRAGAFVHPALADQWALVVNEAMAAGLPVLVSTGAGCTADLVRDGVNGFRFAPTDEATLAALLGRVADASASERAAMGAASERIIAGWDLPRFSAGLAAAVEAGRATSARGLSPAAWAVLTGLRLLTRSATSFHSIEA